FFTDFFSKVAWSSPRKGVESRLSIQETAMKHDHFVVQSPDKPAQQLLLLFHGVGDNPVNMGQIGSWFAPVFPDALIISIGGVEACGPDGRQWFSVQDISEENRQARIDAIMPTFIET